MRFSTLMLSLLLLFTLSSCEQKISDVGSQFLRDTVFVGGSTIGDAALLKEMPLSKKTVNAGGRKYTMNYSSNNLFVGKNTDESLESWVVLRSPLIKDSLGTVKTISIVLPMRQYLYGDAANGEIDISVYTETGNKATDSAATLTRSDLSAMPVGSFQGTISKDSVPTITITLDSNVVPPMLKTSSLSFVIVPNSAMKTIRAFSSLDASFVSAFPTFKYTSKLANDSIMSFTRSPVYDYHIVSENYTVPMGMFYIRGGVSQRERFVLNTKLIREKLALDRYATINTANLQFAFDPALFRTSAVPTDTVPPVLVDITAPQTADSAQYRQAYGERDTKLPNVLNFQLRNLIETALRTGQDSIVLELRSGYEVRTFGAINVDVEDYNFVRWVLYGTSTADITKRPRFLITYSYLAK